MARLYSIKMAGPYEILKNFSHTYEDHFLASTLFEVDTALHPGDDILSIHATAPCVLELYVDSVNLDIVWEEACICTREKNLSAPEKTLMEERSWLEEPSQQPTVHQVGPFLIHRYGQKKDSSLSSEISLYLNRSEAFGTGQHPTTAGCLHLLASCTSLITGEGPLWDVGTGTGLLAMAAAKLFPQHPVFASDVDADALDVACHHIQYNGLGSRIHTHQGQGVCIPQLTRKAPFSLIMANILLNPLCEMAPDMAPLAPNVLLSGILKTQEETLLRAYEKQGFSLYRSFTMEDWSAVWLCHNPS